MRRGDVAALPRRSPGSLRRAIGRSGRRRPQTSRTLAVELEAALEAARTHRLALDHYAVVQRHAARVRARVRPVHRRFDGLMPVFADVRDRQSVPTSDSSSRCRGIARSRGTARERRAARDRDGVHATLASALRMAHEACARRRLAVVTNNVGLRREASSAAAGALLLPGQARRDLLRRHRFAEDALIDRARHATARFWFARAVWPRFGVRSSIWRSAARRSAARRRVVIVPTRASAELLRQTIEQAAAAGAAASLILPDIVTRDEWLGAAARGAARRAARCSRASSAKCCSSAPRASSRRAPRMGRRAVSRCGPASSAAMLDFYDELRRRQRTCAGSRGRCSTSCAASAAPIAAAKA